MKASARLIAVHGVPKVLRIYPQAETPEEQEWILKATSEKLHLNFEVTDNTIRLLLLEAAEINAR
jgi:hypothetical protein